MNKAIFIFCLLIFIPSCSSFGIRTSTQIPYFQTGDNAQIHLHMDGSIPGSELEANVPIEKIALEVMARINEQNKILRQQMDQERNEQNGDDNGQMDNP